MAADNEPAQPKPEKAASSAGNAPAGTEELKTSRNIPNNAKSANNDNNNNAASNSKNIADNDSVSSSYDSGSNADTPTAKAATIPASTPTPTNANLIVNYLPNSLSDAEFLGIFEKIGPVLSAKIMRNKMTGYSYGYGFVAFADAADAAAAIRSLDGAQLQHKRLKVAYCRRGGGRSGGDNSSGGDEIKNANLFIANLPLNFTEDELERVFGASGEIVRSKILVDHATGVSKGCGFVLFSKTAEADEAVAKLNGRILDLPGFCFTHPLVVKKAKDENRPNAAAAAATAAAHYGGGGGGGGYSTAYRSTPVHVIHHHYNAAAAAKDKEGVEGGTDGELVPRFKTYDSGAAAAAGVSAAPASSSSPPGHALYVYGIGSLATELDLYALFAPFGAIVKVFVVREAATRAGKGFGFVTFGDYRDACLAVQTLNGYPFHKNSMRPLQVSFKTQRSLSSSSTVTAGASETAKVGHHYPPHHPPHSPQ